VIKETTNQDLPEGFQTSEFLLKRGLIDMIIHRKEMKSKLASLLRALAHRKVKVKAVKSRA
jgi:acetyl-CoA carboxylase carboxyl transferase subunit beta